jgi:hypothetical protein
MATRTKATSKTGLARANELVHLYHVTPTENLESIRRSQIDPNKATGKQKCSWFVSQDMLLWAIAHTANRHDCKVAELSVLSVVGVRKMFTATPWPGIYKSFWGTRANTAISAVSVIDAQEVLIHDDR